MDNFLSITQKEMRDKFLVRLDQYMFNVVYAFIGEGDLEHTFTEVSLPLDWGMLLHECLFSLVYR